MRETEDLHAVGASIFGDDESVVVVDFDVAPGGASGPFGLGQVAHKDRIERIGDIDEGGAVAAADEGVVAARHRVGPAPEVVDPRAEPSADLGDGQIGHQIDAGAGERGGDAVGAGDPLPGQFAGGLGARQVGETATTQQQKAKASIDESHKSIPSGVKDQAGHDGDEAKSIPHVLGE